MSFMMYVLFGYYIQRRYSSSSSCRWRVFSMFSHLLARFAPTEELRRNSGRLAKLGSLGSLLALAATAAL